MKPMQLPLDGMRIGVMGKGGAGKSTTTVLLAQALHEAGYQVAVLDADSTNEGLGRALGVRRSTTPLLDYFGGMVFAGGAVTCPVDDPTALPGADLDLQMLPERYCSIVSPGIHLLFAGKMVRMGAGSGCDGPIAKIVRDVTFRTTAGPSVLLADFKAGFEDSARGISASLDWAIVVVDPSVASIELADGMRTMLLQIQAGAEPSTRHLSSAYLVEAARRRFREARLKGLLFVLNQVPDEDTEAYLRAELAKRGVVPTAVIRHDPAIARAGLKGEALQAEEARQVLTGVVGELERAAKRQPASP